MKKQKAEYKILQDAYKKIEQVYYQIQIELEYYRLNFKELTKVTA